MTTPHTEPIAAPSLPEVEQPAARMPRRDHPGGETDIDYTTPAVHVDDIERIAWHMREARRHEDHIHEIRTMAAAEYDRIQEWEQHRTRIITSRRDWHHEPIKAYHAMRLAAEPKLKTIETPHGRSKMVVPTKPKVWIDDPDTVTEWAKTAHPEIVQHKVNVTDVRGAVKVADGLVIDPATGEIVPGTHAEVPAPTWSIDTDPGSPL